MYLKSACQSVNIAFIVTIRPIKNTDKMYKTVAFGKTSKDANFERMTIERNVEGDEDVTFDLKYCGVCHSDIHIADNDLGMTHYPCVPGHELAGVVIRVGRAVTKAVLKRIIQTIILVMNEYRIVAFLAPFINSFV